MFKIICCINSSLKIAMMSLQDYCLMKNSKYRYISLKNYKRLLFKKVYVMLQTKDMAFITISYIIILFVKPYIDI